MITLLIFKSHKSITVLKRILKNKVPAYNLQETLITLAIIGILLLLAMPKLMPLISKTKSLEAQTQLKQLYNMQLLYSYTSSKFSGDFGEIDFEAPRTVKEGGTANYAYEILSASTEGFKARATAIVDFDRDGIYNVWEINENGIPKQLIKD
jgi:type IV pilus assembly protein PilE